MIDSLMMRAGVMFLLVGMVWGIEMGIRQDFSMAPAHAHFNLAGGVLLFVFGLYYRMVPSPAIVHLRNGRAGYISLAPSCSLSASRS